MKTIFENIKDIAFEINSRIRYGELDYSNSKNATGDKQLKLDVICDKIIENSLSKNSTVKALISEEKEKILEVNSGGKYTVCYDPLDGSSIVDVNFAVGSIFGIYKGEPKGENLIASAYTIFGTRVELVLTEVGKDVKHYKSRDGKLFDSETIIKLNKKGKINSPGGTQKNWSKIHKNFIDSLFSEGYRLRYSGGMVPDLHQILLKGGGLFSYPDTSDKPKGKLRTLFEVFPFALIFEMAGGEAIDNRGRRVLEYEIEHYHDTIPCFFGSKYEIEKLKEFYKV
jgi:fructose-1,6-bisphosphatase I